MCVRNIKEIEVLDKDLVVYKLVSSTKHSVNAFKSFLEPDCRSKQRAFSCFESDFNSYGKCFSYELNKKKISRFKTSPGMYCYTIFDGLDNFLREVLSRCKTAALLKVIIPKGSKIRKASYSFFHKNDLEVILAEELAPLEVVWCN